MTPLSKGVAALVPVNDSVHLLVSVVVGYDIKENDFQHKDNLY